MAAITSHILYKRLMPHCRCTVPAVWKLSCSRSYRQDHNKRSKYKENNYDISAVFCLFGGSLTLYLSKTVYEDFHKKGNVVVADLGKPKNGTEKVIAGTNRPDLPYFTMEEVAKHSTKEDGIWVTYGLGVYDISEFILHHPGSDLVMLAAGGSVEPFWHIYQQHNTEQVLSLLETFRIGNLNPDERADVSDLDDPWSREPRRHPALKPAAIRPFNAEPPPKLLVESLVTPVDLFYVRNHLPVPEIDIEAYELEISVENVTEKREELVLSFNQLLKYPKHTICAAVMCGGNRRSEMNEVKLVRGLSWGTAAVGNATWSGAKLSDILTEMGVKSDDDSHVQFEGLDTDPTSTPYGASVPLHKVMDPRGDVLLAYEMNGAPLNRDHGYPVRVIVPGVVGARCVKWLGRIIVSSSESPSHWQQNDYKGFSPSTDWDTVDFSKSPAIQNMPVTSAICTPQPGDKVKVENGFITVKGYAWSGGGQKIVRVDVTGNGGESWEVASLEQGPEPASVHWGWTLWTAKMPVPPDVSQMEIWAKAVDSNYNTQPESFKHTWNLRGVLSNAYHRVKIEIM